MLQVLGVISIKCFTRYFAVHLFMFSLWISVYFTVTAPVPVEEPLQVPSGHGPGPRDPRVREYGQRG